MGGKGKGARGKNQGERSKGKGLRFKKAAICEFGIPGTPYMFWIRVRMVIGKVKG